MAMMGAVVAGIDVEPGGAEVVLLVIGPGKADTRLLRLDVFRRL